MSLIVQDSQMCFGAEAVRSVKCVKCNGDHFVVNCQEFNDMSCENKVKFIRENSMCFNCLWKGHRSVDCRKPPVWKVYFQAPCFDSY